MNIKIPINNDLELIPGTFIFFFHIQTMTTVKGIGKRFGYLEVTYI